MTLKELVIEAKTKLGNQAADIIAQDLQIEDWDGEKGICPFHEERTPSFLWNKKDFAFKCFGCGRRYGIIDHYINFNGLSNKQAIEKLLKEQDIEYTIQETIDRKEYFKNYIFPHEEGNNDRSAVEEYLGKRHISIKTLDFAGIKQDNKKNIVFEHKDESGILVGVKYRPSRRINKGEDQMWWQKDSNNCPILYNINNIDISNPLVIVEGHIDCLSVIEAGITNVVSIPHGANNFSWIEFNWEFLENFDKIILWADNDQAGKKMIETAVPRLGEYKCFVVQEDEVIKDKIKSYYKELNPNITIEKIDANNVLVACGKDSILSLIDSAKGIELKDVAELMSSPDFDIQEAEKIPFPYKKLNKTTFGSIKGSFTIVSGETGGGKSTSLGQMAILSACEIGKRTFIYSGELISSQLKSWILYQAAGRRNIIEWNNGPHSPTGYSVTKEAKERIEKHYQKYIYYYDNFLKTKPDDIISSMKYACMRYGTEVFVIDNLMCVDFSEQENEYKAQTDFIRELLRFTQKYQTYTFLVAHPKKPNGMNVLDPYMVSGTSNIVNLCHRLFWIKRTDKEEKMKNGFDAKVLILKDRYLGGTTFEAVYLYYDPPTRRLYSDQEELELKYSWGDNIKYEKKKYGDNGKLLEDDVPSEVDNIL